MTDRPTKAPPDADPPSTEPEEKDPERPEAKVIKPPRKPPGPTSR